MTNDTKRLLAILTYMTGNKIMDDEPLAIEICSHIEDPEIRKEVEDILEID